MLQCRETTKIEAVPIIVGGLRVALLCTTRSSRAVAVAPCGLDTLSWFFSTTGAAVRGELKMLKTARLVGDQVERGAKLGAVQLQRRRAPL